MEEESTAREREIETGDCFCVVVSACVLQSALAYRSLCVTFKSLHMYAPLVNFRVQEKSFTVIDPSQSTFLLLSLSVFSHW